MMTNRDDPIASIKQTKAESPATPQPLVEQTLAGLDTTADALNTLPSSPAAAPPMPEKTSDTDERTGTIIITDR